MQNDILADVAYLGLGSRLKRLSERFMADAAQIHIESGERLQPGQFPLFAAIDRYGPLTVNEAVDALGTSQPAVTRAASELVKAGLVDSLQSEDDKRQRTLTLTDEGKVVLQRLKAGMWPRVEMAASEICADLGGDILALIGKIEARLSEQSMYRRVHSNTLEILPFSDERAANFYDINAEWIEKMFALEAHDRHVLSNPREMIIEPGGEILFVRDAELGVIGACALQPDANGFTELTKMGVRESARGKKAGEFLLRAVLERARERSFDQKLYLVTNWKCAAAIHLYEKLGFQHDQNVMDQFGKRYARCDVAMRYAPKGSVGHS